jgi:hypothetical protein
MPPPSRASLSTRRVPKSAAQRDAELDKLTVKARLAVGLAGELTTENLRAVLANLTKLAKGDGHIAVNAARLLMELAKQATDDDEDDELTDDLTWDEMTPAQRVIARARADALARSLELGDLGIGVAGKGEESTSPAPAAPTDPRTPE